MGLFLGLNRFFSSAPATPNIKYGRLYNWYAVSNALFAPAGWHVPDHNDMGVFIANTIIDQYTGAYKLREVGTTHWMEDPFVATNEFNFTILPAGTRESNGIFSYIGYLSKTVEFSYGYPKIRDLWFNSNYWYYDNTGYAIGSSVRLVADTPGDWNNGDIFTDSDGNMYDVVIIGTQAWLKQNWACTKLNDGTPILNVTDDTEWAALTIGAYCNYDNNVANVFL